MIGMPSISNPTSRCSPPLHVNMYVFSFRNHRKILHKMNIWHNIFQLTTGAHNQSIIARYFKSLGQIKLLESGFGVIGSFAQPTERARPSMLWPGEGLWAHPSVPTIRTSMVYGLENGWVFGTGYCQLAHVSTNLGFLRRRRMMMVFKGKPLSN